MSCDEIENSLLDYQENGLSAEQRMRVESHLLICAECRLFAQQLEQLDAALSAAIKVPALSATFERQLRTRIAGPTPVWSEAKRDERKRQLHEEFEAGLGRIRRGSFTLDRLLATFSMPALAMAAGGLAWLLTRPLTGHLSSQSLGGLEPTLLPWLAASAVFLVVTLPGAISPERDAF